MERSDNKTEFQNEKFQNIILDHPNEMHRIIIMGEKNEINSTKRAHTRKINHNVEKRGNH